jgi:branched-chain amino acid transport system substrate-binding protein
LAVAAASLVAACTGGDDDDVTPTTSVPTTTAAVAERPDDGVLTLGVYLPLTGPGRQLGEPMVAAVNAAVDAIDAAGGVLGSPVALESLDEGAGTGPGDLLARGVDAIVGPASSLVALSQLGPAVDTATGVVVCSPTATSLALDDYPDDGYFFRTAPSDSLQMAAIARQARITGVTSIAVGYLDDPYGRGLADAFDEENRIRLVAEESFSGDQEDLSGVARALLADDPGVIVVLGDADDGSRLLAAIDAATDDPPQTIVNDSIRTARATIQGLSPTFRERLVGVAPQATAVTPDGPGGFFTAQAVDCVNLIALATLAAGSDAPKRIRAEMPAVSSGGRVCESFEQCASLIEQGLEIDYNGYSGRIELSTTTGDPSRAWFVRFGFDDEGNEIDSVPFEVP